MSTNSGPGGTTIIGLAGVAIAFFAWMNPLEPKPATKEQHSLELRLKQGMAFEGTSELAVSQPGSSVTQLRSAEWLMVNAHFQDGTADVFMETGRVDANPRTPETDFLAHVMSGSFTNVLMDARGRVLESRPGHRDRSVQNNPLFVQQMRQMEGAMEFASAAYPSHTVAVGDSWSATANLPLAPNASLGLNIKSTLQSVVKGLATIQYTGKVSGAGDGTVRGRAVIDMGSGWPTVLELSLDFETPTRFGPAPQTLDMRQEYVRVN